MKERNHKKVTKDKDSEKNKQETPYRDYRQTKKEL